MEFGSGEHAFLGTVSGGSGAGCWVFWVSFDL